MPVYEVFQSYTTSENISLQLPIFGAMFLFASTLIVYSFDFLRDIKFWQNLNVKVPKFGKFIAAFYILFGVTVLVGIFIVMFKNGEAKLILVGEGIKGYLNFYTSFIVVLIGIFILLKSTTKKITALLFPMLISLVSALSVFAPLFLLKNVEGFKFYSDFIHPLTSFTTLFLANVLTVSYFEKEKDLEGNTLNIWNTYRKLAQILMFAIPVFMLLLHWLFRWNIQHHSIFYVFAVYLIMYYFPNLFQKGSIYRIIIDMVLLLALL